MKHLSYSIAFLNRREENGITCARKTFIRVNEAADVDSSVNVNANGVTNEIISNQSTIGEASGMNTRVFEDEDISQVSESAETCDIIELVEEVVVTEGTFEESEHNYFLNTKKIDEVALVIECEEIKETDQHFTLTGRRIVDINFFLNQIKLLEHNPGFDCDFRYMDVIGEHRKGYGFSLDLKCKMCGIEKKLYSEPSVMNRNALKLNKEMDVTTLAVAGALKAGIGKTGLDSITSAMDIPIISNASYSRHHVWIGGALREISIEEMKMAAEEEKEIAIQKGNISPNGFPKIAVSGDGAWCKRSYGKDYSSLGGIAAIIGYETKKVLYIGVKNKFCQICAMADNRNQVPHEHTCYKNWDAEASSSSMEATIIVDGFKSSEEMYGLQYEMLVADGDSSVYKKILEANPYKDTTVIKIECINHLMRNYCNKFRTLGKSPCGRVANLKRLKGILLANILRMRSAVMKAIDHWKIAGIPRNEAINLLKKDILNVPYHVFGDHQNCASYFCEGRRKEGEINRIAEMRPAKLLSEIDIISGQLAKHSRSLMEGKTTNDVESFNATVASMINGKRVNYTSRGGYHYRAWGAVVKRNGCEMINAISKKLANAPVGSFCTKNEKKLILRRRRALMDKRCRRQVLARKMCNEDKTGTSSDTSQKETKFRKKQKQYNAPPDADYGPNAEAPDMNPEQFLTEKANYLMNLEKEMIARDEIQQRTKEQADSPDWMTFRRKRITASNFGKVCKLMLTTNTSAVVMQMLYTDVYCPAMDYGISNEDYAREQVNAFIQNLQKRRLDDIDTVITYLNVEKIEITRQNVELLLQVVEQDAKVENSGLFIHDVHAFLAASPDGVIGSNIILEIKCPFSSRNDKVGDEVSIPYLKDGKLVPTHNYYYQIQGQLEMVKRPYCIFAVWTPTRLIIDVVERNITMWEEEMLPLLHAFYHNCLIYELVDPRKNRSMNIRNVTICGVEAKERTKVKKSGKSNDEQGNTDEIKTAVIKKRGKPRKLESEENVKFHIDVNQPMPGTSSGVVKTKRNILNETKKKLSIIEKRKEKATKKIELMKEMNLKYRSINI